MAGSARLAAERHALPALAPWNLVFTRSRGHLIVMSRVPAISAASVRGMTARRGSIKVYCTTVGAGVDARLAARLREMRHAICQEREVWGSRFGNALAAGAMRRAGPRPAKKT